MTARCVKVALFGLLLLTLATGCGGGAEKGKNKDFDRPVTPKTGGG